MKKLGVLLVLLAGVWLVAEVAIVPLAESQIEEEVAVRTRDVTGVGADIDSFPLAARVLLTGRVRNLEVRLEEVVRQRLLFAEIRFELEGIEVDRPAILRREVRVNAVARGTAEAIIDLGALSRLAGRALALVGEEVRVRGSVLEVGPASFQLPSELLPCELDAQVLDERIVLSCTLREIPPDLLRALQRR